MQRRKREREYFIGRKGLMFGRARVLTPKVARSGFSLLEVILALALSTIVIGMIAMAVHSFMVILSDQQLQIEQKQVARSVLMMLGNDARAAVQYKHSDWSIPVDIAALGGGEGEEEAPAGDEDSAEDNRPTLFGNNYAFVIDISRLPRLDEYSPIIKVHEADKQFASDVKTVSYFFSDQPPKRTNEFSKEYSEQGGLYRRQIDRSVAQYRGDTGIVATPDEYTKLIAPEIAEIQFRYWDGEEWQQEWDSIEMGGFPLAIEFVLKVDPYRIADPDRAGDEDEIQYYRSVVHLPLAEMPPEEE